MPVIVSDTSPIRALAHLGRIDLLRSLFGMVLLPPAVDEELGHPRTGLPLVDVHELGFISVRAPKDHQRVEDLMRSLDPGESEALALVACSPKMGSVEMGVSG